MKRLKFRLFYFIYIFGLFFPSLSFTQSDFYKIIDKTGWIHSKRLKSGVHLGAIGAGKFELFTDGSIDNCSINNNWDRPLTGLKGIFPAVFTEKDGEEISKVLKLNSEFGLPSVKNIKYKGEFPAAYLIYEDPELPLEIQLTAFSPLVPGENILSSLPISVFKYKLKNKTDKKLKASLMMSWENLLGIGGDNNNDWINRTGNYQEIVERDSYKGLYFKTDQNYGNERRQNTIGEYFLICDGKDIDNKNISVLNTWNILDTGDELWDQFSKDGKFDNRRRRIKGSQGEYHPAGAIAIKFDLKEGEEQDIIFVFSWYMPYHIDSDKKNQGHFYTNYYSNAFELAKYAVRNHENIFNKIKNWQNLILDTDFPYWLKFKLLNDICTVHSNTVYTKNGQFSTMESPVSMGGALGTMDQRFSSHAFLTACFPELDKTELNHFGTIQRPDGEIPHFSGNINNKFGSKSDYSTTQWPDISCSFIMQIYKYYLLTGDEGFFKKMYPNVKRAVLWLKSRDFDGNLIPEGGSTWDYQHYPGTFSYNAVMWLGALKASVKMAEIQNDIQFGNLCRDWYQKARDNTIDELWNGRYLIKFYVPGTGELSDNCFIGQLAGQWYSHLVNLGLLIPENMVKTTVKSMLDMNASISDFFPPNEVTSSGEWCEFPFNWLQYSETYLYCLSVYSGYAKEGLNGLKKIFNSVVNMNENPWDVRLYYNARTGKEDWGKWYMTNPASWFILYALSGFSTDHSKGHIILNPNLPSGTEKYTVPVFTPKYWFKLNYYTIGESLKETMELEFIKVFPEEGIVFKEFQTKISTDIKNGKNFNVVLEQNKKSVNGKFQIVDDNLSFIPDKPVVVKEGDEVKFSYMIIKPESALDFSVEYNQKKGTKNTIILTLNIRNLSNALINGESSLDLPADWMIIDKKNTVIGELRENETFHAVYELKIPEFVLKKKNDVACSIKGKLDFKNLRFEKKIDLEIGGNYICDWNLLGPFSNVNNIGFNSEYPPEMQIDLKETYQGFEDKNIKWFKYSSKTDYIDLNTIFGYKDAVTAYALCWIFSPEKQVVKINLNCDDGVSVIINEEKVWSKFDHLGINQGANNFSTQLQKGWNKILLKFSEYEGYWGFTFEILDKEDQPIYNLEYTTDINQIK